MSRAHRLSACFGFLLLVIAGPAHAQGYPEGFLDPMPLFETALGDFARPISTGSPEAQAYFDQGMAFMYAFTPYDAARAFRQAQAADPTCAICHWGEAWAWGPYLNGAMGADDAPRAHAAIQRAVHLRDSASPAERDLIDAMALRYAPTHDPDQRRALDEAYADAMADVWRDHPADLDAGTLYGEALMLLEPRRGNWDIASPTVQQIHRVLEEVLAVDVTHPGACHLYIHATEPTVEPGKAEACADHLGDAIPGASHINHMPSHTYNRIGRWGDAVRANIQAWHSDLKSEIGEGFAIYPSHNLHMLVFAASMDGQGAVAIQAGKDYGELVTGGVFYEGLALMRFGRFDEVLEIDDQPEDPIFRGLLEFSRGYAHLRLGDRISADASLRRVRQIVNESPGAQFRGHTVQDLLGVVGGILEGEMLRADGDLVGAIETLAEAVRIEDGLRYDEPEPLNFSARHWLGAALLDAGRPTDAELEYRLALEDHPLNGWSLFGLEQALRAQDRTAEADEVHQMWEAAWARSDTWIRGSRF
jgi:tetratricopeptide (TPR) repeat protein